MRYIYYAMLLSVALAPAANAQAFGVQAGDPISSYQVEPLEPPGQYKIVVPQPHPEFESYIATATPETGICRIGGIGKTHQNDSYGTQIRRAYNRLRSALGQKYGPSKEYDFLHSGSIWNEPNEFGWSLYKDERSLSSFWDAEKRSINLGDTQSIMLEANAVSPTGTWLMLNYEFTNHAGCLAVLERADNSGL